MNNVTITWFGIHEAAWAASLFHPEIIIPCHYNTFPTQIADIREIEKEVESFSSPTRVIELKPGGKFVYPE